MRIFYNEQFNIDLGLLNYLHPFDGTKFRKVVNDIKNLEHIVIDTSAAPISTNTINEFLNELMEMMVIEKKFICRALEIPHLPFISFNYLDKKILYPMRLGVGNTLAASKAALKGEDCWNLAGGYHHASQHNSEGFCIYNDIGIAYQELIKSGMLTNSDCILIIDTDAHHGNGNARTFKENTNITLLDVYNRSIYPMTETTRERVDIAVPLTSGVTDDEYLSKFEAALQQVTSDYKIAYIVAGTDVLESDPLGQMMLSLDDVVQREKMTLKRLKDLGIPAVFLGGGGYSKESAKTISATIKAVSAL